MTKQQDLFTTPTIGQQLRDEALARVAENAGDFMSAAMEMIEKMPSGEATGEEIRQRISNLGLSPHHPNAWGALIRSAVKEKLITPTGVWSPMRQPKSHARRTPVYYIRGGK